MDQVPESSFKLNWIDLEELEEELEECPATSAAPQPEREIWSWECKLSRHQIEAASHISFEQLCRRYCDDEVLLYPSATFHAGQLIERRRRGRPQHGRNGRVRWSQQRSTINPSSTLTSEPYKTNSTAEAETKAKEPSNGIGEPVTVVSVEPPVLPEYDMLREILKHPFWSEMCEDNNFKGEAVTAADKTVPGICDGG